MDIANVTLVEIVEDRVIVLDGKEYLVVDKTLIDRYPSSKSTLDNYRKPENKKAPAKKKPTKTKPRVRSTPKENEEIKGKIVEFLAQNSNSKRKDIGLFLKNSGYEVTDHRLGAFLRTLKVEGMVQVIGETSNATWFLPLASPSWMVPKTNSVV